MFNPAIKAALMSGVISKVKSKQTNAQSTPQKKKKKGKTFKQLDGFKGSQMFTGVSAKP